MSVRDIKGNLRWTPRRIVRSANMNCRRALTHAHMRLRAARATDSIVDEQSCVTVSLTSHGARIERVHLAIESIARGTALPRRVILYLDAPGPAPLPESLQRLRQRGLEVQYVHGNYGPHTKYYPYVSEDADDESPLVTADDDVMYPKNWLVELLRYYDEDEDTIVCHRAHRVLVEQSGIKPYLSWPPVKDTTSSVLNFATGVSGVIYSPKFLARLRAAGEGFRDVAPRADDVWLHRVAVHNGFRIQQVSSVPLMPYVVLGTQATSLRTSNVIGAGNDSQIRRSYNDAAVHRLLEAKRTGLEE